ncbi:ead/Ea22-like family protein [Yersinia mollaretii]|uniref:ead/Ea22-like family protein n=1 Tax=Yersinia mollaretii TaxID=33060 RepID=UPI001643C340|nr:ead/Ea22-like family protein [Yersinia mollaretii]
MNNIEELKKAAMKATQGEWWQDVVETEGTYGVGDDCSEGFHSYAVYGPDNNSLLDMTNSTAAIIHTEEDGDYLMAWDETGRRNAEYIALANPAAILDLIAQLEAAQKELFDLHNQEFQQRLANAEHQLYMKDLAIHNIKASRKAQFRKRLAAESELSAANEKLSKPVVLNSSTVMSRAYVVQAIKAAGFTVEGE